MPKIMLLALIFILPACSDDVEQEVPRTQAQPAPVKRAQIPPVEVATIDTVQAPIKVSIEINVTELPDRRVRIHGTTNLPADTSLMLSVAERVQLGFHGQSQSSVAADGSFDSEVFGPGDGLKDGGYVVEVLMPIPAVQPDNVKKLIGVNGEMLSGPLVQNDSLLGVSVSAEKEFIIGGEQAVQAQQERLKGRIQEYDEWVKKITTLHSRLQAARDSGNTEYFWQQFAPQFRTDIQSHRDQLKQVEPVYARLMIVSPLDAVRRMFTEEPFEISKDYIEASTDYIETLKELEQFIADAKSTQ